MKFTLDTPVSQISKVGTATASRLEKLGIFTVEDLIFYYPFRYEDFSQVSLISDVPHSGNVTIYGTIELIANRRSWKRKTILTEGIIKDKTGSMKVVWFNQPYLTKVLKPGDDVYLSGRVSVEGYAVAFVNPIYEKIKSTGDVIHTARLVPMYSTTEKLTQKQIRWLISVALESVDAVDDWLPAPLEQRLGLLPLRQALRQIHFPSDQSRLNHALRRLKFDELFLFLLQTQTVKKELLSVRAPEITFFEAETQQFVSQLPFTLTIDQKKAAWQIIKNLSQSRPMNRLLEGDVGSGKTVVAILAAFNVALNNYQTVVMAPTEILASQHFKTFSRLLAGTKCRIGIVTKSNSGIGSKEFSKSKVLQAVKNGRVDIVIGTHALIQEKLAFDRLALAVIDEQHRFGVEQRKILHQKGSSDNLVPHFLSMTATPIPRSLALTLYGDLEVSIIRQLPSNRQPIETRIILANQRPDCYRFITQQVASGRQVFVVCPLIDPSDRLGVKSATEEYQRLRIEVFPNLRIGLLHGKLKPQEKKMVMEDFVTHKTDILVSTSVVEVGVDVPNASVMMVEGADRFGLAQIHQFRGRVGRGPHKSYCFLLTDNTTAKTRERLQALVETSDGFALAEKDLALRGPGQLFGVEQSGWPEFRLASLFDQELVMLAKTQAQEIIQTDPTLAAYPLLAEKLNTLNRSVHLE